MAQEIIIQGQTYMNPIWIEVPVKLIIKNGIVIETYFENLLDNGELFWWRVWDKSKIKYNMEKAKKAYLENAA